MLELTIIQKVAVWAIPLLFAITLHEVAHGFVASLFGDQTARFAGRLTINPIKHIDLVGTIILPLLMLVMSTGFIFGWAKPVPVDARNLRNPRTDLAIVAAAGPLSNILMAVFWAGIIKLGYYTNPWFGDPLQLMGEAGVSINLVLGVLNCIPIPPLDGGRILYSLLPPGMALKFQRIEPYGFFILIFLLFSGVLSFIIYPVILTLRDWIFALFQLI